MMSSDPLQQQRIVPPSRRRDKPILSCNLCRRRKLKCDRQQPCKACVDRGLSLSCTFSRNPHAPATPFEPRAPHNVHDRINQLEKLVTTLMEAKNDANHCSPTPVSASGPSSYDPLVDEDTTDADIPGAPDRVKQDSYETSYTNSGHWTSILDGIAELKEHLDQISTAPQTRDARHEIAGPDLLFGRQKHATRQDILAGLPSKLEADRLVSTYYAFMEMAPSILHRPTFQREYDQFWVKPASTPVMWLGLMFSIFAVATRFQTVIEDEMQEGVTDPPDSQFSSALLDFYREKVVQCLIHANYVKCPPYTLETMLTYFIIEYLRSRDTQYGNWLLIGMVVRTAFRMGYHREPSRFSNISPFKAEIRRRMWAVIIQLDLMSSVQVGLPMMIQPSMYDVLEPRNLTDEDVDENMPELPVSRPDTDSTAMLYVVIRNRVLQIFARIMNNTTATEQPAYRETLELDAALKATYESIPDSLRELHATKFDFDTQPDVAIRKLYLGMTFLKSQLMLHRPFLILGRTDNRYRYSRSVCLDAAMEILEYQRLLTQQSRPGGMLWASRWRLWTSSWRISSLANHDFLLATTVLVLDLDKDIKSPMPENNVSRTRFESGQPTRAEIVEALTKVYDVWVSASDTSREAAKVAAAVKLILEKAARAEIGIRATTTSSVHNDNSTLQPSYQSADSPVPTNTTSTYFDFNNPNDSLPFPMADIPMPMEFGGAFDWGGLESDAPMPAFEQNFTNSYFG